MWQVMSWLFLRLLLHLQFCPFIFERWIQSYICIVLSLPPSYFFYFLFLSSFLLPLQKGLFTLLSLSLSPSLAPFSLSLSPPFVASSENQKRKNLGLLHKFSFFLFSFFLLFFFTFDYTNKVYKTGFTNS